MKALQHLAMNIVNQLFDLAEVPVPKRQAINDRCDEFVRGLVAEFVKTAERLRCQACNDMGRVKGKRCSVCDGEPIDYSAWVNLQDYLHTVNLNVPLPYRQPQLDLSLVRMRDALVVMARERDEARTALRKIRATE